MAHDQFSFYLQSHHSALGTAKSAHYFVIQNEMNFTRAELHSFTFDLCYMPSRALTPLSVCPPARYADLLCERLRHYMRPALDKKVKPAGWNLYNSQEDNLALYEKESNIWASDHNAERTGRTSPWGPYLDHMMVYL